MDRQRMVCKMDYCKCGLPLNKRYNKRFDNTTEGYCNKECQDRIERSKKRTKNRKKYGVAGSKYDYYHSGDIFKWDVKGVVILNKWTKMENLTLIKADINANLIRIQNHSNSECLKYVKRATNAMTLLLKIKTYYPHIFWECVTQEDLEGIWYQQKKRLRKH